MLGLHLNSKILLSTLVFLTLNSCGVKSPPAQYPETIVDSYIHDYTDDDTTSQEPKQQTAPSVTKP